MEDAPNLAEDAPWKQRFRARTIWYTEVAKRAPSRGLAISDRSGVVELYAWDVGTTELRQLTDRPRGTGFGAMSPDGRYVYYHHDEKGAELGHHVRVPWEGGEREDLTPDLPPFASWSFHPCYAGNRLGFVAAREGAFTAYCVDLAPNGTFGEPRAIYRSDRLLGGPALSPDGRIAVLMSTERSKSLQYSLVALDASNGNFVGELWDGEGTNVETPGPAYFPPVPGDLRLLATSNRTGVERLLIWNPRTGERRDLAFDLEGAARPFDWSPDGRRILLRTMVRAVQRLYVYDLEDDLLTRLNTPPGTFTGPYFVPSGEILAHWQDSTHPSQLIALDGKSGVRLRDVLAAQPVPPGHAWRSVAFPSAGGEEIQGWLGVPDDRGPFPTIVDVHGGPQAVTVNLFSPHSQAWLDHGFAFLTINYHGSVTFGKEFEERIWGHPGRHEMEDLAAAHGWLVAQGIARPDQVFVTGASYGGYLTLMALGKRPDLWAGGMAVVAIADWTLMYEDAAETLRGYQRGLFGGTPAEKAQEYAESSPITYADRVRAPLIVIQGRNDTRCPARQMETYEAKMRELGKEIEIHWFDAGHGTMEVERGIEHQEMMLRFAFRVLTRQSAT